MFQPQFRITEESLGHHYNVVPTKDAGNQSHIFIENSPSAAREPDLTFYNGPSARDPPIGLSKFSRFSKDCDVRVSAEELLDKEDWVTLKSDSLMSMKYLFRIQNQSYSRLAWKKTRSMGLGSSAYGNMILVSEDDKEVLAVFSPDAFSLVSGRLDILQDYGELFNIWVLVTGITVREKLRRRTNSTVRAKENVYTMGAAGGGFGASGGGGC